LVPHGLALEIVLAVLPTDVTLVLTDLDVQGVAVNFGAGSWVSSFDLGVQLL
jgi:hypothetical protein